MTQPLKLLKLQDWSITPWLKMNFSADIQTTTSETILLLFPPISTESLSHSGSLFSRHTMKHRAKKGCDLYLLPEQPLCIHQTFYCYSILLVLPVKSVLSTYISVNHCSRSSKLTLLFNCWVSFHFLNDLNNRALLFHPLRPTTLSKPKSRSWT